jgi:hypothetical protein
LHHSPTSALQADIDVQMVEEDGFDRFFSDGVQASSGRSSQANAEQCTSVHEWDILDPGAPVWTFFLALEHVFLFTPQSRVVTLSCRCLASPSLCLLAALRVSLFSLAVLFAVVFPVSLLLI